MPPVLHLDCSPNNMSDNDPYVAVRKEQFVDYLAAVEIGLVLVVVHTFHLVRLDSMYQTVLHTVGRNWDRLLVDNMFGIVVSSTYLADVDHMESSSLVDMLDNAFDVSDVGMDRVLAVDNGMFVVEVYHLESRE